MSTNPDGRQFEARRNSLSKHRLIGKSNLVMLEMYLIVAEPDYLQHCAFDSVICRSMITGKQSQLGLQVLAKQKLLRTYGQFIMMITSRMVTTVQTESEKFLM